MASNDVEIQMKSFNGSTNNNSQISSSSFKDNSSSIASLLPAYTNERWFKFSFLVGGIMFFFGCHNYMQELIMNLPGFKVIFPNITMLNQFISYLFAYFLFRIGWSISGLFRGIRCCNLFLF